MLRYLNGESNVKGGPNENYGREFMELFTLGVDARHHGREELQRERRRAAREVVHRLATSTTRIPDNVTAQLRLEPLVQRPEVALRQARQLQHRQRRRPRARPGRPRAVHRQQAVGRVHADAAADRDADSSSRPTTRRAAARSSRSCAASSPNPQLFESIDEPNMIKPPVVFVGGALRALGLGITSVRAGRLPRLDGPAPRTSRRPWRAGRAASRGSTRTPRSRASASSPTSSPTRRTAPRRRSSTSRTRRRRPRSTVRTAPSARPGCRRGTRAAIQDYATRASAKASKDRIARQVMLRTLMLAGPDAQVM